VGSRATSRNAVLSTRCTTYAIGIRMLYGILPHGKPVKLHMKRCGRDSAVWKVRLSYLELDSSGRCHELELGKGIDCGNLAASCEQLIIAFRML
jgi:hypothetical protein